MKVYKSYWFSASDSQLPIRQSSTAAGQHAGPSLILSEFKDAVDFYNPPSTYWLQMGVWQRFLAVGEMDLSCPSDERAAGFITARVEPPDAALVF